MLQFKQLDKVELGYIVYEKYVALHFWLLYLLGTHSFISLKQEQGELSDAVSK